MSPATVDSYAFVTPYSVDDMKESLLDGVLAVVIQADQYCFQLYSGGIFDNSDCFTGTLDHATNVVGFGDDNGTEYWIMRNSWGTSWGDEGYIYIAIEDGAGICGIQLEPMYPIV